MRQFNKRWLAIAAALAIVVSAIAVGLSLTYAASPVQERFKQPNAYANAVEKGRTETRAASGLSAARSNDTSLADVVVNGSASYTITGKKAGAIGVAVATKSIALNPAWQVTDSSLISGYDLANNGEINKKSTDAAFNINDSVTTYTTAWNATVDGTVGSANYVSTPAAKGQIAWSSRNTSVATVTAAGTVTPVSKGTAILLGDFTDRWGVPHTMVILLGIDTIVGKTMLNDLLDAIRKGEAILALDPNPYEDAGLGALQNVVDAGKELLYSDPSDTQITNAINAIENAIDALKLIPIIVPPSGITTASLPNATKGTPYHEVLTSNGDAPITWTLESGSLPAGLTLNSDGTISGTPTSTGTATFTIKAANSAGSVTKAFTLTVDAPPPSLIITGFAANSGYLRADGTSAALTGQVRVKDKETGNETWTVYDEAIHGGTLTWTLDPSDQSAALSDNKFLKTTTTELGTIVTVRGTLATDSNTYTSIGNWFVVNADGSVGGGALGEPVGAKGRSLTVTESGTATTWHEIAGIVINGKSFSLILRDKSIGNSISGNNGLIAQTAVNTWWMDTTKIPAASFLRKYTYKPSLPPGQYGTDDGGAANNYHDGIDGFGYFLNGWSLPNPNRQAATELGTAFLLSYAEAAKFCSTQYYNNGTNAIANSSEVAQLNWGRLSTGTTANWWLRSSGPGATNSVSVVRTSGDLSYGLDLTSASLDLRPALWVSSDIFSE